MSETSLQLAGYPLLDALLKRGSRRFGLGMRMASGPLAHASSHGSFPLSEEEEALLMFAACGITGFALLDQSFAEGQGGAIVARALGRTIASGDAIQTVSLVVINDDAAYLIKRPQDFPPQEIHALLDQAQQRRITELYRRMRVRIKDGRAAPPLAPMFNVNVNRWSLYAPGTTYFLPINELTFMYINSAAVEATTAYCEYIYNRCGRFPAYMPPFRTVLGFQACHLDNEFYDRFYRAGPGRFPKRNAVTWTGGTSRTRMGPNKSISASSPKQACARAGVACFRQPFGLTMQGKKNSRRP